MNNDVAATVAVVFRERVSPTVACLKHLIETTKTPYKLICVDSGSPEAVAAPLRELAAQHGFTLIRSEAYLSPNESRNLALAHVQTPYVVFVDNDVEVGENWLEPLIRCAEETGAWLVGPLYMQRLRGEEKVHMFGGVIENRDASGRPVFYEKHQLQHSFLDKANAPVRQKTGLIEFHTVLMNMEAYRTLGPLDEKLFNTAEHADLSLAVKNAGKEIYVEPASVITYLIPDRLDPVDKRYFDLRWSENWTDASLNRLAEKHSVPRDALDFRRRQAWVRLHRQRVLAEWPTLRAVLGKRFYDAFTRRISRPLERRLNMKRFPVAGYVEKRGISASVVLNP